MDEHKHLAHGHTRTEKTRVKLGPENLVKVTLNGINGKVEIDWRKRVLESWKSVEVVMCTDVRL